MANLPRSTFATIIGRTGIRGNAAMLRQMTAVVGLTLAAATLAPVAVARTAAAPATCQAISRTQVTALFEHWNKALLTKRTDAVVAEYAADATLLPTVQDGPLIGRPAIGGYFNYFLKQSPEATIESRVIHIGCNIAYDIGLYAFMVDGDQPGTRKQVKARYTFIYAPVHARWVIVHHHSSALPPAPSGQTVASPTPK
jgi:uncharacterized protein (TIGR02246 family)